MIEQADAPYGDPISAPFWEAATRHELILQRCSACGAHQFYPRQFCLQCSSSDVEWMQSAGNGTVYSMTTVRAALVAGFDPPYIVALVELDEGPRLMTTIVGGECEIGDRVRVSWSERPDGPPLPVFRPITE